jgi:ubiquinone/menaquinone biosynthesis C-methylase UbiE
MTTHGLLNAHAIVSIANLQPGMRVADFGAGRTGHFVIPLARVVGEDGAVYAVDIHPEALSMMQGHRSLHVLPHMHVVRGDIERFEGIRDIQPKSLDRIFLVNTLWMARRLSGVVQEARRLLRSNGQIVVVDWEPGARHPVAPPSHIRVSPHVIDQAFQQGGCVRCDAFRASVHHWGRVYGH